MGSVMGDFRSLCERCYAMRPDGDEARHWSEFKGSDGHFHIVCPDCEPVMESAEPRFCTRGDNGCVYPACSLDECPVGVR